MARLALPEHASRRHLFALAWPVMAANFLQTFATFVDLLMVGHLGAVEGKTAVNAVGAASLVVFFNFSVMIAISAGTIALVSRSIGAGDPAAASRATKQSLLLGFLVSLPLAAVEGVFAEDLMRLVTTGNLKPEVVLAGAAYLRVLVPVMPLFFSLFLAGAAFRGAGDTRTPLYVGVGLNLVNFTINLLLIFGLAGFPRLGVVGAAVGTAIATGLAGAAYLVLLARGRSGLRVNWRGGLDRDLARRLLRVGLPAGVESVLFQVGITLWVAMVSVYGDSAYAAHVIGLRVQSLAFMPGIGLSVAASALAGQYLGARRPEEAEHSAREAAKLAILVMGSIALVNFVAAPWIAAAFGADAPTQALTVLFIRIHALSIPAVGLYFTFEGALKGAGDTRYPLLTSIVGIFVVRLPLAFVLGFGVASPGVPWWVPLGLTGIWFSLPVEYLVRSALISRRFRSGRWKSLAV